MVQRHAKEDKLAIVRQAAAQGESQTREVQQAASLLHPAITSLLKALKPPGSAKEPALPEPSAAGQSSLPTPEHFQSHETGAFAFASLLPRDLLDSGRHCQLSLPHASAKVHQRPACPTACLMIHAACGQARAC